MIKLNNTSKIIELKDRADKNKMQHAGWQLASDNLESFVNADIGFGIKDFSGGINNYDDPRDLQKNEFTDVQNWLVNRRGQVRTLKSVQNASSIDASLPTLAYSVTELTIFTALLVKQKMILVNIGYISQTLAICLLMRILLIRLVGIVIE